MNYSEKQSKINSDIRRRQILENNLREIREGTFFYIK